MARYPTHHAGDDGWCEWVQPDMALYKMACCDCGLVHGMQFRIVDQDGVAKVQFRARRENRATGQIRRHRHKGKPEAKDDPNGDRKRIVTVSHAQQKLGDRDLHIEAALERGRIEAERDGMDVVSIVRLYCSDAAEFEFTLRPKAPGQ